MQFSREREPALEESCTLCNLVIKNPGELEVCQKKSR